MVDIPDEDISLRCEVSLSGVPDTQAHQLYIKSHNDTRDIVWIGDYNETSTANNAEFCVDHTTFLRGLLLEVRATAANTTLASRLFDNPNLHNLAHVGARREFDLYATEQDEHYGDFSAMKVVITVISSKPYRRNMIMEDVNRDLVEGAGHGLLGTVENRLWMGADRNYARAVDGYTALCAAAEGGLVDVLECLLDFGADINDLAQNGRTALSIAAAARRPEAVALLLQRGAFRTIKDQTGLTAVQIGSAFPEVAAVFEEYRPKRRSAKSAGSSAAKASAAFTGAAQAASARPKGAASSDTSTHSFSAAAPVARGSRAPMSTDFPEKGNRRWSSSSAASSSGSASSSTSTETRTTRLRAAKNLETKKKLDYKEEKEKEATMHMFNKKRSASAAPAAPAAAAAPSGSSKRAKVTSAPAPTASIPAFPAASAVASSSSASSAAPAASSSGIGGSAAAASSAKPRAGSSSGVLGKRVTRKG